MDNVNNAPMIEVQDLCKVFGDLTVLKGITTSICKGEKVAVIGPRAAFQAPLQRLC